MDVLGHSQIGLMMNTYAHVIPMERFQPLSFVLLQCAAVQPPSIEVAVNAALNKTYGVSHVTLLYTTRPRGLPLFAKECKLRPLHAG